jgi:hypothetical protein
MSRPAVSASSERCEECGSQLAQGQRHCLDCGARAGSRSPQLLALLRALDDQPADGAGREAAPAAGGAVQERAPGSAGGLTLPAPKISALLVLVFLGFGVLLGGAASSSVKATLAAQARPQLKLVLPPAVAQASPSSSSSSSSAASSREPPLSPETATARKLPRRGPPRKRQPGQTARRRAARRAKPNPRHRYRGLRARAREARARSCRPSSTSS